MRTQRTLKGAAIVLTGALAACTPAGSPAPTGPAVPTGGISSPASTAEATPTSVASAPGASPAATVTAAPTTAASPAAASPGPSPAALQVAYATFAPQAGSTSSVSGAATLISADGSTMVVIGVVPADSQPIAAAIQEGTCASPNPLIKFNLTPLVAGASVTSVPVSLADVLATDHVVNLFVAGSETESSISCGDIQALPASAP